MDITLVENLADVTESDEVLGKNIHSTDKLENLPCFTFSGHSRHALADLFKQYPPGRAVIEAYGNTTHRTEEKEDDIFSRPLMNKVEITKRLEILSEGMKDSFKLKLVNFFSCLCIA